MRTTNVISSQGSIVIAMLILLLMSTSSLLLLQGANLDLQMVSALSQRLASRQQLEGGAEHIIVETGTELVNVQEGAPASSSLLQGVTGVWHVRGEASCKRRMNATSANVLSVCRFYDLELQQQFGKRQRGTLILHAGVEQPIIHSQ